MKKNFAVAFCLFLLSISLYARISVAVVYSSWPEGMAAFKNEFDRSLSWLDYDVTKFENTQIPELTSKLANFQLVIISTTGNYSNTVDLTPYAPEWINYLNQGGRLFIVDASYDSVLDKFLNTLGEDYSFVSNQCSVQIRPSAETSKVTFSNDTMLNFPCPVVPVAETLGHWSHFHHSPADWKILEYCYDHVPLTLYKFVGKGAILVTVHYSLTHDNECQFVCYLLNNLSAACELRKHGLTLKQVLQPTSELNTRMSFTLAGPADILKRLEFTLQYTINDKVTKSATKADINYLGEASFDVPVTYSERGEARFEAKLTIEDETIAEGFWKQTIPDVFWLKAKRTHLYPNMNTLDILYKAAVDESTNAPVSIHWNIDDGQSETVKLEQPEGVLTLPVETCSIGLHKMNLKVLQDGKEIFSQTQDFYRHEEPMARIRQDGTLLINGKPFFPLGFYHVSWRQTPEHRLAFVQDIAKYGYNCVRVSFYNFEKEGNNFTKLLDECHRLGVYVIPEFGCDPLPVIKAYKDHPAILGWDPGDEPASHGIPPEKMYRRYNSFKQLDPDHLVYTVICMPKHYKNYASGTDVLAPDPYPIPDSVVDYLFGRLSEAYDEARKYATSLWSVPQCFGGYKGWKRPPNAKEYRVMLYLSLSAGVKGLISYTYYDDYFFLPSNDELYQACKDFPAEFEPLKSFVLNGKRTILQQDNQGIYITKWELDDKKAFVVINTDREKARNFIITGHFGKYTTAGVLQNVSCTEEGLKASLPSMERALFFLEP